MKKLVMILSLLAFTNSAFAAETIGEKAKATVNDVKRDVKQKVHKAGEKRCKQDDESCVAKKSRNKAKEAGDYTKDKIDEGINVIDNDK